MVTVFVDFVHPDVVVFVADSHHYRIIGIRRIIRVQTISSIDRHQATLTIRALIGAHLCQLAFRGGGIQRIHHAFYSALCVIEGLTAG